MRLRGLAAEASSRCHCKAQFGSDVDTDDHKVDRVGWASAAGACWRGSECQ